MIYDILLIIIFCLCINWCASLQMLAQTRRDARTTTFAVIISIALGLLAGTIAIL